MKLNELDLNKFHVFRVVAESASMREAGERLLRTPSAVSQSVSALERDLGIRLFDRVGIRLRLTEVGRRLLEQVRVSEAGFQEVLEEIRGREGQLRGRATLGMPPGYPAASLADVLGTFLLSHPETQLRLRFQPHAKLAASLRTGKLDLALSLQPLRRWSARIHSRRIRKEELILAIPGRFRSLADQLPAQLPVVDYFQKPLLIEGWLRHHAIKRIEPRIRVYGSNLEHVLAMVRKGVGCAVVPRHLVQSEITHELLFEHRLDRRRPWRVGLWLNTVVRPQKQSSVTRLLGDALLGMAGEHE